MRLQIAKILPLTFADTLRRICAERNDPEHQSTLYLRFGSILKQIREKRGLTIQGLSVLSGVREDTLEEAESGRFEMADNEFNDLRNVYWTLETDQASAADYKRIVDQRLSKPYPDFGFSMTQIREEKQISIGELASISGLPEDILRAAESGTVEMTDEVSKEVKRSIGPFRHWKPPQPITELSWLQWQRKLAGTDPYP